MDFPEPAEIGFGYAQNSKRGSGVGTYLTELILEALSSSPALLTRGIRHIEELQLVSVGINRDRISDIAANVLKSRLIDYTQRQCDLWSFAKTPSVPVAHIYNEQTNSWEDGHFDLPTNPIDGSPYLLVPRRIVRSLPWINYDEFFKMEFSAYHRAKVVKARLRGEASSKDASPPMSKSDAVSITRSDVDRIERYVTRKESTAGDASPSAEYLDGPITSNECDELRRKLLLLQPGLKDAAEYQRLVLEILNFLFLPDLIDGRLEVATIDGTERRDIIFTNDSDKTFWSYLRNEHSSLFLMFETKNTSGVEISHINQVATYIGTRIGFLALIVTRNGMKEPIKRKVFSVYNDSSPRKVILAISDAQLLGMIDCKCSGRDPMRLVQELYRDFRLTVQ